MKKTKKLKITTRGRYAVMAMAELGKREGGAPVPLVEIAKSGDISLSYLEQLFTGLRKNNLVKSYRGPGGGYVLAKPASDIKIADILSSAEDCAPAKRTAKDMGRTDSKQTDALWNYIGEILYASMKHISLDDVIKDHLENHPMFNKIFEILA